MHISHNKYRNILWVTPILVLLTAGPAPAQTAPGAPIPLAPMPLAPTAQASATPGQPSPAAASAQSGTIPAPVGPASAMVPASVSAAPIGPPDPDSGGALSPGQDGFPATMWFGTARNVIDLLLPQIGPTVSPTLNDLALRLLETPATAPSGGSGPGVLTAVRASQLASFGHPEAARQLMSGIPPAQLSADAGQVLVDLAFLDQDAPAACAIISGRDKSWQGVFWDEARLTCQILGGQTTQAQIGLDMLTEEGASAAGFAALISRASGYDAAMPQELPAPQPLSLALLQKAASGLPPATLTTASLGIMRAIAETPGFPDAIRLIAAEKAAAFGALPPDKLAEAYLAFPLEQADRDTPMTQADLAGGAKGRAILFNAARDATTPDGRAQYLDIFIEKSATAGLYPAAIRAAEPLLKQIPASAASQASAAQFARALYALDEPAAARPWFDLLPPGGQQQLLPLAHITGGPLAPDWGSAALLDPALSNDKAAVARAGFAAGILNALGTPAPDSALLPLLAADGGSWERPVTGPPLLLTAAAERRQIGETVLTLLTSLGTAGAAAPAPLILDAIAALRKIGMTTEARHLALDAAIAAGL